MACLAILLLASGTAVAPVALADEAVLPLISELKPLLLDTLLTQENEPAVVVLCGEGTQLTVQGSRVATQLTDVSDAAIEVSPASDYVSRWWEIDFGRLGDRNVIAIGNINNNRLIAALWGAGYTAEDSIYPGIDGYVVRSVHDPFAKGFNVIVVAGSTDAGAAQAVDVLLDRYVRREGGAQFLEGPVLDVQLGRPPSPYVSSPKGVKTFAKLSLDFPTAHVLSATVDRLLQRDRSRSHNPESEGNQSLVNVTGTLADLAKLWFKTGDAEIPPIMKRVVAENLELLQAAPERIEMEGGSADHLLWWDIVEELPVWTDEERLALTNAFLRDARQGFEPRAAYQLVKQGYVQVVDENHGTQSALHLLNAWQYFDKYYDLPDSDYWMSVVRATFAGQIASHQMLEDSATYQMLAPGHVVEYSFRTRDLRYFRLGIAKTHLDFMLQAGRNNLGLATGFGDSEPVSHQRRLGIASMAWFLGDPQAMWWLRDYLPNDCGLESYTSEAPWDNDLRLSPPENWSGVTVLPIYQQALGHTRASKRVVTTPATSAGEEWFNKIVLRDGVGVDQQYLLLDGAGIQRSIQMDKSYPPGPIGHHHRDTNTIINYSSHGRMWLVDHTYSQRSIVDHSGLVVTQNGIMAYEPCPARLLGESAADQWCIIQTQHDDFSGTDWRRSLFWRKGRYVMVLDQVIAREAGEYAIKRKFRTLGEHRLDKTGLWLEQQGRWARVLSTAGTGAQVEERPYSSLEHWSAYPYSRPIAKDYTLLRSASLSKGESLSMGGVLVSGNSQQELAPASLRQIDETGLLLKDGTDTVLVGVGSSAVPLGRIGAYAFADDEWLLTGVTRIGDAQSPLMTANHPVDIAVQGQELRVSSDKPTRLRWASDTAESTAIPHGSISLRDTQILSRLRGLLRSFLQSRLAASSTGSNRTPERAEIDVRSEPLEYIRLAKAANQAVRLDLDGDSRIDWLVATDTGVVAADGAGDELWRFATDAPCRTLDAADIDRDGIPEVVVGCDDEHAYLLDAKGQQRWSFRCRPSKRSLPPAVDQVRLVQFAADSPFYILVAANWLHCLRPDGTVEWEDYQKYERGRYAGDVQTFAVDDFNDDGKKELLAGYLYNYPVMIGYDRSGKRIFPEDRSLIKHGGLRIPIPQALALTPRLGDGSRAAIAIATRDDFAIRSTDSVDEGRQIILESGCFQEVATTPAKDRGCLVFAGTDMGAVFCFRLSRRSEDTKWQAERLWVRSTGKPIAALHSITTEDERTYLWVGSAHGSILRIDGMSGSTETFALHTELPVVQFLGRNEECYAICADGAVVALPCSH